MSHRGGHRCFRLLLLSIAYGLLHLYSIQALAAPGQCDPWVARIISVQGTVDARAADDTTWQISKQNQSYCPGDVIRVHANSRAAIELNNETVIRLDQSTTLVFPKEQTEEDVFWLDLIEGAIHVITRITRSLKIKTPYVNAAVEGTEFTVRVQQDETLVSVIEGHVAVENDKGSLLLAGGQSAVTRAGEAPVLRLDIRPRDAVHWTLYYPSVLAIDGARDNEVREKLLQVESMLTVGRVNDAEAGIASILQADPQNSDALALRSIITLVQNNKDQSLALAKQALDIDPGSISAMMAMSYALQAEFNLAEAKSVIEDALRVDQKVSLVWARYAELQLSLGDLDGALVSARHATALDPAQARSITVLGFAYLSQFKVAEAMEAFTQAIILDQADPLPRLGYGLGLIRQGEMAQGRREIEIAATLDSNNALVRSYLGKAYYEERRDRLAADQFDLSKALDPLDPTPWFYNAILKQSQNRPIEALSDLQKSIDLNNNRAVYRSRLMLDQDLAARSASLARIYDDLGFQQLALAEGWKSVNADASNHSAHRFLADSYAALPRHEIARVSELLQAQLLQPVNLNPIQPEIAESNLGILDGTGPSGSSINEFNPMFFRNRFALQLNGISGGNNTSGGDIIHSAVIDKVSYSLGRFHYETDSFRANNDQDQDITNAFVQTSPSHKTSIQFEYRESDVNKGDLPLRFDPADFDSTKEESNIHRISRFGLRYSPAQGSHVLLSAISSDSRNVIQASGAEILDQNDGQIAELQYLLDGPQLQLEAGIGSFRADWKSNYIIPSLSINTTTDSNTHHDNLYIYSHINPVENINLTTGLSWDTAEETSIDIDQFNPKFGLIWDVDKSTTLRMAVFRALKRNLVADQTLEPTQVAGFNQFFDDPDLSDAWRYGIAMDHRITNNLYSGLEVTQRNMNVNFLRLASNTIDEYKWHDHFSRTYIYWMPTSKISISADYQYEYFRRPEEFAPEDYTQLITHRVPLAMNLFLGSGITIKMKTTFVKQDGSFIILSPPPQPPVISSGDDQFWVTDTEIRYRLPRRYGIVSLGVKNIFDEHFSYQDTDPVNPQIIPERQIFTRLSLSF